MSLEYWYMLPVSVLIATIAMASGVEGATFFAPFFILALHLSPDVAIGSGLITEVFGFASGPFAYARQRLIDYSFLIAASGHLMYFVQIGGGALPIVLSLAIFTVPGTIIGGQIGSLVAARIPQRVLEVSVGMLFILVAGLTLGQVML